MYYLLAAVLLGAAGCDSKIDLNQCDGAPAPPTNGDYLDLDVGTAVVDGPEDERLNPDGRLELPAEVLALPQGGGSYVNMGASDNLPPLVFIQSFDYDALAPGDEFVVSVGYNVSGSGEGGSGRLRVTRVTPESLEGTFAGCVRLENRAIPLYGPYRTVRGGFNATRD